MTTVTTMSGSDQQELKADQTAMIDDKGVEETTSTIQSESGSSNVVRSSRKVFGVEVGRGLFDSTRCRDTTIQDSCADMIAPLNDESRKELLMWKLAILEPMVTPLIGRPTIGLGLGFSRLPSSVNVVDDNSTSTMHSPTQFQECYDLITGEAPAPKISDVPVPISTEASSACQPRKEYDEVNETAKKKHAVLVLLESSVPDEITRNQSNTSNDELNNDVSIIIVYDKVLGKESFGTVKICRNITAQTTYAVKIVPLDDELAKRQLVNEIELLPTLDHDGIIKFYGYVKTKTKLMMFIQYMWKGSLDDRLRALGHLTEEDAKRILKVVLEMLVYLHAKGIGHGDIKSRNVLLNENGSVVVSDFGSAEPFESKTEATVEPDVATRQLYGIRECDIWNSASLFVEMFTGVRSTSNEELEDQVHLLIARNTGDSYELSEHISASAKSFLRDGLLDGLKRVPPPHADELLRNPFFSTSP